MQKDIDSLPLDTQECINALAYMIPQMSLQNILETAEQCREKSMRSYNRNRSARSHNKHKGNEYFQTCGGTRLRICTDIKKTYRHKPPHTHTHKYRNATVCFVIWWFIILNGWSGPDRLFSLFLHLYFVGKSVEFSFKKLIIKYEWTIYQDSIKIYLYNKINIQGLGNIYNL